MDLSVPFSHLPHFFSSRIIRGTKTTCYLPPPPAGCSTADICGIIGVLQRQPCMEPHPEEKLRAVHDQRHLDPRGYVEGGRRKVHVVEIYTRNDTSCCILLHTYQLHRTHARAPTRKCARACYMHVQRRSCCHAASHNTAPAQRVWPDATKLQSYEATNAILTYHFLCLVHQ